MNGTWTDLELNLGHHLSNSRAPVRYSVQDYDLIGAVNSYSFRVNVYISQLGVVSCSPYCAIASTAITGILYQLCILVYTVI